MESRSRRRALAIGGSALLGKGILAGAACAGAAGTEAKHTEAAGGWQRLVVVTADVGRDRLGDVNGPSATYGTPCRPTVEPRFIREHFGSDCRNLFVGDEAAHRVPMSVPVRSTSSTGA